MRSKRANEALRCSALVLAAAVLGWGCAEPRADKHSFQRAYANMRSALNQEKGPSLRAFDDNAIVIGAVTTPNSTTPNLTRMPSEMWIKQGNTPTLTWVCWDCTSFTLTFKPQPGQKAPLDKDPIQASGATAPVTASATVNPGTPQGRYKFTVDAVLWDGTHLQDPDCPPIIIQ